MSYAYRQDLNWLVTDFTARVPDVAHAAVVSADGVPLALSEYIPAGFAGQLAAIVSGLTSLMQGAARLFEAGRATQALVEMEGGLMFVMAISDGSSLTVLAAPECDTDLVAYEMTMLVEAVGDVLTPAARAPQGSLARTGLADMGIDVGQVAQDAEQAADRGLAFPADSSEHRHLIGLAPGSVVGTPPRA